MFAVCAAKQSGCCFAVNAIYFPNAIQIAERQKLSRGQIKICFLKLQRIISANLQFAIRDSPHVNAIACKTMSVARFTFQNAHILYTESSFILLPFRQPNSPISHARSFLHSSVLSLFFRRGGVIFLRIYSEHARKISKKPTNDRI